MYGRILIKVTSTVYACVWAVYRKGDSSRGEVNADSTYLGNKVNVT